jgi:hypothetical protein
MLPNPGGVNIINLCTPKFSFKRLCRLFDNPEFEDHLAFVALINAITISQGFALRESIVKILDLKDKKLNN